MKAAIIIKLNVANQIKINVNKLVSRETLTFNKYLKLHQFHRLIIKPKLVDLSYIRASYAKN